MSSFAVNPNNISILPKPGCYGCGVCVDVCPTECITLLDDQEGFPYPSVDQAVCIECRKCINTCPGLNDIDRQRFLEQPVFYAGYSNDDRVRYLSSSGGFFSLVAEQILAEGGVVYGAQYDFEDMTVKHARVDSREGLAALRKSKYVQSSTVNIFPRVRTDLAAKRVVLFTGTPCQVEGLYLFLGEEWANLFTCDIVCHGVPSPGLFKRHFKSIEQTRGQSITDIDFRTKDKGWKGPLQLYLKVKFGEEEQRLTYAALDAYYALFLANLTLRPCCYGCQYATTQRRADLTLGDFWGVKQHHPDLFDSKGTSLVLANTEKGDKLLKSLSAEAKLALITDVRPFPPNLAHPTPQPKFRDRFFQQIDLADWHHRKRWFHLRALAIIARDKAWGFVKKFVNRNSV